MTDRHAIPHDRYELADELGSGGQGTSYLAEDTESGTEVVVKRLAVEAIEDWKSVELFERAVEVLERLDHPAIPAYVDAFEGESEGEAPTGLYFVREFVDGASLQELIDGGERFTEAEALEIAAELFDILTYLHGRDPPVVHRDIKPANIIRRPDGSLALVDFGAVQEKVLDEASGSTVVGTAGYVPPEQLTGEASPASDLYAVGATLVHLLTHRQPSELSVSRMKLQFRDQTDVSEEFASILDRLLAPDVDARFESVESARRAIASPETSVDDAVADGGALVETDTALAPPDGSGLSLEREDDELRIVFPGDKLGKYDALGFAWIAAAQILCAGGLPEPLFGLFALSAPIVAGILVVRLFTRSRAVELVVDSDSVRVRRLGMDREPIDTIYRRPLAEFPGIAEVPFAYVANNSSHMLLRSDTEKEWHVTREREAGEQFRFRDSHHFLTIPPDDRPPDELEEVEAARLPYVFIKPGADLTLGERRWVIDVVDEAIESHRSTRPDTE